MHRVCDGAVGGDRRLARAEPVDQQPAGCTWPHGTRHNMPTLSPKTHPISPQFAQWMATNNLISGEQTAEVQLQQQQLLMHAQHCLQQLLATQPPLPQAAPSSQQPPPQPVPPQQPQQQQQAQQQQPPPQPPQLLPMPMPMPQPVPQSQYDAAAMQLPSGLPPPPLPQEVAAQQMQLPPPMQGTPPRPPTGTGLPLAHELGEACCA
eukprot:TRINITY_DN5576_c0_g1_i6.p1 TRINITY_DN5576_c0_g1~~TRINITY_DN5576_c0_g1_i6.p1  ORF type:complete len:206 (+),score=68.93 TRINITY_DN5576_c0_g1_i6:3-620(+)